MADRRFPIFGTSVPPMLGREAIMNRMMGALTKPTPDHLQVVGARSAGKTVILHELVRRLRADGSSYTAVVLWDLGHQTPATDELFMRALAQELSAALRERHAEYAEYLQSCEGNPYQEIAEVLAELAGTSEKVLVVMDGFDKPLANGQLTRNLWDQLRELGSSSSLRLVTASRRTLHSLIRNPEAQTSDFWGIFDQNPVRVGVFDEKDLEAIVGKVSGLELAAGAKTELWNASNGFPVVMLDILNVVCEATRSGPVSAETMNDACDSAYSDLYGTLDALWEECPSSCKVLLRLVLEQGQLSRKGKPLNDIDELIGRGFVQDIGGVLQRPSRMLQRYLNDNADEGNALALLFGTPEGYEKHLKGVMGHRIAQISSIDPTLKRYLESGTEELPDHPPVFMSNVRGIVDQAFELIWQAELGKKTIPSDWMSLWKHNRENVEAWETNFPQGVKRLRLLQLMTGTQSSPAVAKYVNKGTYFLMNAVHGFGDFGQHREGAPIDAGMAYSVLHLCVELAMAVTRELPASRPAASGLPSRPG